MDKPITYLAYRRKSTDDDRQVLSLDSQETEIKRKFPNLKIIDSPPESVSAFKPYKRPVFKRMVELVESGKVQGIVAWHPDRLSRNPIDAAQIIYMLDIGKLKDLKFCSYNFDNSPEGKMMLAMVMSQSKYSSDKLSKDVKRGINIKAGAGERPTKTPIGYLNSKTNVQGSETNIVDPQRFQLVKELWNRMLTGNYSVPQILKIANDELHLTQPATLKLPERKMRLGMLYSMFTNTFYYGWYDWPEKSDNWVKGNHQAMITEQEFDEVQRVLGRKNRRRPKTHNFTFTGMIRCGGCGATVTAEEKFKHQKNGNEHHYIYYHCTKKVNSHCTEKSLEEKELVRQIDQTLKKITISEGFTKWALKHLHEIRKDEAQTQEKSFVSGQSQLLNVTRQLDNLMLKLTSPENATGNLISDDEYQVLKGKLLKQKSALEETLSVEGRNKEEWLELSERTFNFARYARIWFAKGDIETKRAIFSSLGSNLLLKDQKIVVSLKKPFQIISEGLSQAERELEPLKTAANIGRSSSLATKFSSWSR